MKNLHRWLVLGGLLLLPLNLQAKNDDETGQEKVCFCHNVSHDPHTICTADPALIQAHMDHVNGEVPGVEDSLDACESEPDPSEDPTDDDGEQPGDDDGGIDDCEPGDDSPCEDDDSGEEDPGDDGEPHSAPPPKDQGGLGDAPETGDVPDDGSGTAGGRGLSYMEGSGCSLNAMAAGTPGGALPWALLAAFPLLWTRRR